MKHNHPHIDMMQGLGGFSSLREFDSGNKSPLIKINISRTQSREEDKGIRSPKEIKVVKRLNLNKNILEEELNSMHIDDRLAEQLMLQEDDAGEAVNAIRNIRRASPTDQSPSPFRPKVVEINSNLQRRLQPKAIKRYGAA